MIEIPGLSSTECFTVIVETGNLIALFLLFPLNLRWNYGKVIEVDYNTKNVLIEAALITLSPAFTVAFHRTEPLSLYP